MSFLVMATLIYAAVAIGLVIAIDNLVGFVFREGPQRIPPLKVEGGSDLTS